MIYFFNVTADATPCAVGTGVAMRVITAKGLANVYMRVCSNQFELNNEKINFKYLKDISTVTHFTDLTYFFRENYDVVSLF